MDSSPRRPPLPVVLRQGGGDVLTVNHIYAQRFKKINQNSSIWRSNIFREMEKRAPLRVKIVRK